MIKKRIRYILTNYKKKFTIYDYIEEPKITIKKGYSRNAKYEARPIFNSIRVGNNNKDFIYKNGYRKYRMKNKK